MFTVIIPTMWRWPAFETALLGLINHKLVDEIIVVNNDKDKTPAWVKEPAIFNSISIVTPEENIGPNQAWNLANKACNDYICLMNDDIIFDVSVFNKVLPYLQDDKCGIVGLHPGVQDFHQTPFINGQIDIKPWTKDDHTYGFGCLMFCRKDHYMTIPSNLFLYYGDNYLFDVALAKGWTNYLICNLLHFTPFAETTKDLKADYLEKETPLFKKAMEDIKWAINIFNIEEHKALTSESDIKDLLPWLKYYALQCQSVLELGVRTGISTRVFLNSNLKTLISIDIIEDFWVRDLFKVAEVVKLDYKYIITDSRTFEPNTRYDLLFIDTEHKTQQLATELEQHAKNIEKYILLHDVFTYGVVTNETDSIGLLPAVLQFLANHREWTVESYETMSNGLLVLKRA